MSLPLDSQFFSYGAYKIPVRSLIYANLRSFFSKVNPGSQKNFMSFFRYHHSLYRWHNSDIHVYNKTYIFLESKLVEAKGMNQGFVNPCFGGDQALL